MKIWEYVVVIVIIIMIMLAIGYYFIKKYAKEILKDVVKDVVNELTEEVEKEVEKEFTTMHHLPIRKKGFTEMPAVPFSITETIETIVKLGLRTQETKMAKSGLSTEYTIQGETQSGYTFMYDDAPIDTGEEERMSLLKRLETSVESEFLNKETLHAHLEKASFSAYPKRGKTFTDFFLGKPTDFSMSWTNYYNVYEDNIKTRGDKYASILTDPEEATKQFWPMIAENGLAYNLLFLQKVEKLCLKKVKSIFHKEWDGLLKPIQEEGLLYAIDLTIFNNWDANKVDGFDRWTPGAFIILEQDKDTKKLRPICVQISNSTEAHIYTPHNTQDNTTNTGATWIYALAAARTAVTVYGIWLGHVYHWHIVSAPMQMTLFNNVKKDHDLRKLLDPQSKSLIGFNDTLLLLWKTIGPPTSFSTPDSFLELTNTFATGREFFEDDPKVALDNLGLNKDDFTDKEDWDRYPIVKQLLYFWDASEGMVDVFVETTYKNDAAVSNDTQLQKWMTASSNVEEGNVRGLPKMDSKKALKSVLTSLVYRVVAHGNSRQMRSLGPGLSFVANYPPCIQNATIVKPDDATFKIDDILGYLPNTGTIGSMMTFYYIFIFSAPYEPLLPLFGNDTDLYFSDPNDPRNIALEAFRKAIEIFIIDHSGENSPLIHQWPASIET
ncbi:lipoxygenase family protein [Dokdonia sp.]|uniref:lipoxygenase family protein n=1 Tax=Dokdonia sp. TaxID=2024995 RepID=UPI0032677653